MVTKNVQISAGKQKHIRANGHRLERFGKGIANHWRIAILLLLAQSNDLTLETITETLGGEVHNMSQHTVRLVNAGLVNKRSKGQFVLHSLSPYGKDVVKLLLKL